MNEEWRKTEVSENYEVSSKGRVRSLDHKVKCGPGKGVRLVKGRILKPHIVHHTGYEQVILDDHRKCSVHRLVALAFVPGYADGLVVNHKNGDRRDNRPENLEWVSQSENNFHAYRALGRASSFIGKTGRQHPTSKTIIATEIKSGISRTFQSAIDATHEINGLDSGSISRCCHGEYASHKGYRFRFATDEEAKTNEAFGANHGVAFHWRDDE